MITRWAWRGWGQRSQSEVRFWQRVLRDLNLAAKQQQDLADMRAESMHSIDSLYIVRRMLIQQVQVRRPSDLDKTHYAPRNIGRQV